MSDSHYDIERAERKAERLEAEVRELRAALQACMDDFGITLCYCTELAKGDCAFCMGSKALLAQPAATQQPKGGEE